MDSLRKARILEKMAEAGYVGLPGDSNTTTAANVPLARDQPGANYGSSEAAIARAHPLMSALGTAADAIGGVRDRAAAYANAIPIPSLDLQGRLGRAVYGDRGYAQLQKLEDIQRRQNAVDDRQGKGYNLGPAGFRALDTAQTVLGLAPAVSGIGQMASAARLAGSAARGTVAANVVRPAFEVAQGRMVSNLGTALAARPQELSLPQYMTEIPVPKDGTPLPHPLSQNQVFSGGRPSNLPASPEQRGLPLYTRGSGQTGRP